MISSLFLFSTRYRGTVLIVVTLITLLAATGLNKLVIDTSFNSLIPEDDPDRLVYQRVMGEFGSDNRTIIYVEDADLWTPEKLASLESLHTSLKQVGHVNKVDSLFNLR
ncbi:MAG TPA: hypothetical protein QF611_10295, partial [Pseudomonadales bacterium]|nr:hypothetical protein [Pseudomonadales bacterium]